jgi:hypothetical protein
MSIRSSPLYCENIVRAASLQQTGADSVAGRKEKKHRS